MKLSKYQKELLVEASRRWLFLTIPSDRQNGLTAYWSGFGSATTYRPATRAGLMRPVGSVNRGYSTWWRLTSEGAAIVQTWIDEGLSRDHFDARGILSARGCAIVDGSTLEATTLACGVILTGTDRAGSIQPGILLDGNPSREYRAAVDGILSLILAHYCAGLDVTSYQYQEGIATTLDAIANHHA